ncbi:MAG: dehydrogenase, partial [Thermoplasmata archaeon]
LVGFVAEVSVFVGTWEAFGLWIFFPIISVALTAGYYLFAMQRAIFGPYNEMVEDPKDLRTFETVPLAVLTFTFVLFGILPILLMDKIFEWVAAL